MIPMTLSATESKSKRGAALIIVLSMLVLLLGLIIAFLASSGLNRQTSVSSASLTAVDLMASVAINSIAGELQQEITDSNNDPADLTAKSNYYDPPNGGDRLYLPKLPADAAPEVVVPASDGTARTAADLIDSGLENVVKISTSTSGTYTGTTLAPASKAAAAPTDEKSRNGRRITAERWNKPLLMERTASDDDTPKGDFKVPDWILVARDGSHPTTLADALWDKDVSNRNPVIGRYAYMVYNQGGLLDANVAGYPSSAANAIPGTNITNPARYKTSSAYADLTQLGTGLTQADIDTLVQEWRNEATLATDPAENYFKLSLQNKTGFLSTANTSAPGGATDRMFISRQQLIHFFEDKLNGKDSALMDSLEYLTTFSRSIDQPTFYRMQGRASTDESGNPLPNYDGNAPVIYPWNNPASDLDKWTSMNDAAASVFLGNNASGEEHIVNPIIPAVTMATSGTRMNGSTFKEGDPILKKRFNVNRVLWITYKGPSASLIASDPGDPVFTELEKEGITTDFLEQGTAANIEEAFGLTWTAGPGPGGLGGYWTYTESSTVDAIRSLSHPTQNDGVDTLGREPNFFEILRATVNAGAIGRARSGWKTFRDGDEIGVDDELTKDSSINNQIFQIGANIIDQAHPENFPTHIVLPDGPYTTRARSFWGVVDLPYLYGYKYVSVLLETTDPVPTGGSPEIPKRPELEPERNPEITQYTGCSIVIQTPLLWNPHAQTPLPPGNLSPQNFRICVTSSALAIPSAIGTSDVGVNIQRVGVGTGGGRLQLSPGDPTHPEYWNWSPRWQENADATDIGLGVLRFANDDPTALLFNFTDPGLFRHPTHLIRSNFPAGLNVRITDDHALANMDMNSSGYQNDHVDGIEELTTGDLYLGFLVGRLPVLWNVEAGGNNALTVPGTLSAQTARVNDSQGQVLTYSLEYTPDGTNWIPYKQVALQMKPPEGSGADSHYTDLRWEADVSASGWESWIKWPLGTSYDMQGDNRRAQDADNGLPHLLHDPRTTRWGANAFQNGPRYNYNIPPTTTSDPAFGECWSIRTGTALGSGYDFRGFSQPGSIREGGASSKTSILWDHANHSDATADNYKPFYDADGVLRRPMASWVGDTTSQTAASTIGLPMASGAALTTGDDRFNRPIILHRPFRSVAELSHVFSDAPWRNIDFSTPESGYPGLLDVFTIHQDNRSEPVIGGKVDLNTRQMPVLKALLAGGYRDAMSDAGMPELEVGASEAAELLANALIDRTSSTNAGKGPLWNVAHLVGRYDSNVNIQAQTPSEKPVPFDGFSSDIGLTPGGAGIAQNVVQRLREAPIRVLSNTGQAGTWNLLVDIVAQTGRYPTSAGDLNDFMIEAEKRVWLHIAIDRITGKVISQEIEVVIE